jgi:uncharacterized lipoprotein YmbA
MHLPKIRPHGWTVAIIVLLALYGCPRKPPPNYYLLDSGTQNTLSEVASGVAIGIGPLWVAPHLNRLQVVTRQTDTELKISDAHQWAAPVRDSVFSVIASNLAVELNTNLIYEFPLRLRRHLDYRVAIDLIRLDGHLGGEVILEARWILSSGDGKKMLDSRVTSVSKSTQSDDYSSYIQAKSQAVIALSKEIAKSIKKQR